MKRFIITGMGHSGTKWISDKLRECGVDCTHEWVYRMDFHRTPWGEQLGESSWPAAMSLDITPDPEVDLILHQTRNPLQVSRTFKNGEKAMPMWAFPRLGIPTHEQDPQKRFGLFYARWNKLAEQLREKYPRYYRYQVESLVNNPANVKKLFERIGANPGDSDLRWSHESKTKHDHALLPWSYFSHIEEFLHIGAEYGYL